ncbi:MULTISPECIES: hypothetical protein [Bacteroides]|uniref:hypothetical protein n=1 Tax=Bacteroides TaxID=816 RepID=UPI001E4DCFE0|nr:MULTISPECIES: hypothetical protein [Bacteroides]
MLLYGGGKTLVGIGRHRMRGTVGRCGATPRPTLYPNHVYHSLRVLKALTTDD